MKYHYNQRKALRKKRKAAARRHLSYAEKLVDMKRFSEALAVLDKAPKFTEDQERGLCVIAAAIYGMRKWEEAARLYQALTKKFPTNDGARQGLQKALTRLVESRAGKYDLHKLYEEALKGNRDIDVADYAGKGIIASKDVPKGTLLMASKAFALVGGDCFISLLHKVTDKLRRNPSNIKKVFELYGGAEHRRNEPPPPPDQVDWDDSSRRLLGICQWSSFTTEHFTVLRGEQKSLKGLWILPSYVNHSCLRNAHRTFYGDVFMLHAVTDIKKGEEVTSDYMDLGMNYQLLYNCDCRHCQLDRTDTQRGTRDFLVEQAVVQSHQAGEAALGVLGLHMFEVDLKRQLQMIRATYGTSTELQTQLFPPLSFLADLCKALSKFDEAIKYYKEAIACLHESIVTRYGVTIYVSMAKCYDSMHNPAMARRCAEMAMELQRIRSGHDKELFKKIYPEVAHII